MKNTHPLMAIVCAVILLGTACKKENAGSSAAELANNQPETKPAVQTAVSTGIGARVGGFYQALPARYDSTTKKYPLLVFLHGVGELGNGTTDLPKLLNTAVPRLLSQKTFPPKFTVNNTDYSFIVLNPQFKEWPQPADVNAVIDYAVAHYRVDQSRIYVAGLSMGGGNTWDYAIAYASRVAAVAPICGASWPSKDQLGNIAKANLPVWAFHNSDDGTVGVNTTITNVDNVNSFKPAIPAQKTIWPTGGHDAWTKATDPNTKSCDGKNMYEWLLQYKRDVAP
ncbi:MAG: dienelactone hydrolase family protein [Bacteroidota bacterium]|nr:dienelactone hydrolase family protein [Bacteroidota bacterium]